MIDEQAAAELAQKADDAVAMAGEIGTREAHVAAELACSGAGYAYDSIERPDLAAPFWRLKLKHRDAAERMAAREQEP